MVLSLTQYQTITFGNAYTSVELLLTLTRYPAAEHEGEGQIPEQTDEKNSEASTHTVWSPAAARRLREGDDNTSSPPCANPPSMPLGLTLPIQILFSRLARCSCSLPSLPTLAATFLSVFFCSFCHNELLFYAPAQLSTKI